MFPHLEPYRHTPIPTLTLIHQTPFRINQLFKSSTNVTSSIKPSLISPFKFSSVLTAFSQQIYVSSFWHYHFLPCNCIQTYLCVSSLLMETVIDFYDPPHHPHSSFSDILGHHSEKEMHFTEIQHNLSTCACAPTHPSPHTHN